MPALNAITFDLWATLLSNPAQGGPARHRCRVDALHAALVARGETIARARIEQLMIDEWRHYNDVWSREQRTLLNAERLAWMLEALDQAALDDATRDAVCTAFDDSLWHGPPTLWPGAAQALRELRARGLRLGVVSDTSYSTGRTLRRLLAQEGVLELFEPHAMVFSDEFGASKPRPELFARSLAALRVEQPAHAAHLGDNPATDIRGANAAGMLSVLFDPQGELDLATLAQDARPAHVVRTYDDLLALLDT